MGLARFFQDGGVVFPSGDFDPREGVLKGEGQARGEVKVGEGLEGVGGGEEM